MTEKCLNGWLIDISSIFYRFALIFCFCRYFKDFWSGNGANHDWANLVHSRRHLETRVYTHFYFLNTYLCTHGGSNGISEVMRVHWSVRLRATPPGCRTAAPHVTSPPPRRPPSAASRGTGRCAATHWLRQCPCAPEPCAGATSPYPRRRRSVPPRSSAWLLSHRAPRPCGGLSFSHATALRRAATEAQPLHPLEPRWWELQVSSSW